MLRSSDKGLSPSQLHKSWTEIILKRLFEEAAHKDQVLTPDAAMQKMHEEIRRLAGPQTEVAKGQSLDGELKRLDFVRLEKKAHHFAVDLYYDQFRSRKGAPPLRREYLDHLLLLQSKGLSSRQIAIEVGQGSSMESRDRIRKQLRIAKQGKK